MQYNLNRSNCVVIFVCVECNLIIPGIKCGDKTALPLPSTCFPDGSYC